MTVLVVCRSFFSEEFGGVRNVRERVSAMRDLGYRVVVLHDGTGSVPVTDFGPGVTFLSIPSFFDESMRRYADPLRWLKSALALWRFRRLVAGIEPAAVMVHGERPRRLYLWLQNRARLFFFRHDSAAAWRGSLRLQWNDPWLGNERGIRRFGLVVRRWWEYRRLRRFRNFVANSRYIARLYGIETPIIQYPPIKPVVCDHPIAAVTSPRLCTRLLFVGRLEPLKGPADAIAILAKLPEHYTLTVVGSGESADELNRAVRERELNGRVEFAGALSNEAVRQRMAGVGVLLLTSQVDEAFGAVGVEAFSAGTPVVAYDVGGVGEWCREPAGILVPRGDIAAAARAVLEITTDETGWRTRSAAAREIAERDFGYARFVEQTSAMLQDL